MKVAVYSAKKYDIESFSKVALSYPDIEYKYYDVPLSLDTVPLANECEAICIFVNDKCDKEVVDALYKAGIKLICLRCAGYNNVDLEATYGKIHVVRVPAYSPYAVAEHAMALLLTSVRRIHKAYIRTRDYNFALKGLTGFDLHGKTVGIVGTGKIGKIFANICNGFGMNILGYDKYPASDFPGKYVSFEELLAQSDIISLHCPLTDDTYHLLNKDTLNKTKKGVVIVNTSRGALIDSEALVESLKARQIGAVCLDVYEEESNLFFNDKSGHILNDDTLARLISMPNVIVTSHQAFLTNEALANIADTTSQNIVGFFKDGKYLNEVCYHCPKMNECQKKREGKCF